MKLCPELNNTYYHPLFLVHNIIKPETTDTKPPDPIATKPSAPSELNISTEPTINMIIDRNSNPVMAKYVGNLLSILYDCPPYLLKF